MLKVWKIIDKNNGSLGLGIDLPTLTTGVDSLENQYSEVLGKVVGLHDTFAGKQVCFCFVFVDAFNLLLANASVFLSLFCGGVSTLGMLFVFEC